MHAQIDGDGQPVRKKRRKYTKHKNNSTYFKPKTKEELAAFWFNSLGHKRCSAGKHYVPVEFFGVEKSAPFGMARSCRDCVNARARELHKTRGQQPHVKRAAKEQYYKRAYGLTYEEYHAKLAQQGSSCAICETSISGKQAHLDHNHSTGVIRDFLCTNCNRGLGHLMESELILAAAIKYLRRHQTADDRCGKEGNGL